MKTFLKAGILGEDGTLRDSSAGTPQGSILSPLMSNVALSVLDEHIAQAPGGTRGEPGGTGQAPPPTACSRTYGWSGSRTTWCLMVSGTRAHAEALKEEITGVLAGMGLRLSPEKTLITHIEQGLDFLGWRIQRHQKRGAVREKYVYTYPARKAIKAVTAKVKGDLPAGPQPAA